VTQWWIDEPVLLGSSNPSDTDLQQRAADGFHIIISLLDESAQPPRYDLERLSELGYRRYNLPIADFQAPTLEQIRTFIDLANQGAKVIVHCQGGIGRTGTMAAAYWIAQGMPTGEAIERVRLLRPGAVETLGQRNALREFEVARKNGDPTGSAH
jgi:atypical dual specificity phosphatase